MIFEETSIEGAFVVRIESVVDQRGLFARTFSAEAFSSRQLNPTIAESSLAYNQRAGTLRGLHFQRLPHEETKLVRCTSGAAYDVVVDLRCASPTYLAWHAITLTAQNRLAVYVPTGCAHGYLTLEDDTELVYDISTSHVPSAADGVRWDDPCFSIDWPSAPVVISERDAAFASYTAMA